MELLKTTNNPPWSAGRNKNEKDVEFLRDLCILDINDNMEWKFFLNDEMEQGNNIKQLKNLLSKFIKDKEKRRKNKDKQRRLVIWTSRLNLFYTYIQFLNKDLQLTAIEKFHEGKHEKQIMDVHNKDLEFRNFELISGEAVEEVNKTYSFNCSNNIAIMKSFLEMRQEQGLSDWTQLRYTFANNSLKLFYRDAEFSEQTKAAMKYETIIRKPTLALSQIYDNSCKAGVLLTNKETVGQIVYNVFAADINEAYNAQFVRGNDFPMSKIYKTELSNLAALIKSNKWFLLVMVNDEPIDKMPPWLKPYEFEDRFYYIIEQYDYLGLVKLGLKITTISEDWKKFKLYTCDEVGYLHWSFRKRIVKRYGQRRYLKSIGDPAEKIIKAQFKFLYGKGLQKRNFTSNQDIDNYYHNNYTYVNQIIAYHAMARNRYEMIQMLDRLGWNYVACDTDGIKTQNSDAAAIFEQRNKEIREENATAGFINTKIGIWDYEGCYPKFIQFANKVYAYEEGGKLVCKFAGCLKNAWKETFEEYDVEDALMFLEYYDVKIPHGIVRRSLKMDENGNFYVEKLSLSYGINGVDEEEN